MFSKSLDVGGDDGHVVLCVGDVEEGGLAVRGLEDKEHVGQASLVVPLPRHGLRPDACDGAVTCVTRYGAVESAARLDVIPVYREMSLVTERRWGRGQAILEEEAAYRTIAGSTLIPEFLPRSWGRRS